jgi:6-phosphogluconolactonase
MAFLPTGRFAYAVNELDSTVTSYAYDAKAGALKPTETQTTLPGYYDGPTNTLAEVAAHPSGRWICVSNHGMNSIILFGVDPDKGTLTYIEEQRTGGKTPRHLGIQRSAKHMVICNQDSGTLRAARIDLGNGRLKPSGVFAEAPTPMCARSLPPVPEAELTTPGFSVEYSDSP